MILDDASMKTNKIYPKLTYINDLYRSHSFSSMDTTVNRRHIDAYSEEQTGFNLHTGNWSPAANLEDSFHPKLILSLLLHPINATSL